MINNHLETIIAINYHVQELNLSIILMVIPGYNLGWVPLCPLCPLFLHLCTLHINTKVCNCYFHIWWDHFSCVLYFHSIQSSVLSNNLFKHKLCSCIRGQAILSADVGGADRNVVFEPPNYGSGFLMAFKHHGQGHLLIAEGLVSKLWEKENLRWNYIQ